MPYPTGTEFAHWLVGQGVLSEHPDDIDAYDSAMASAAADWEKLTDWRPFLATVPGEGDEPEVRTFDGNGRCSILLPCGIVSASVVELNGLELTPDVNYWLRMGGNGKPYREIAFDRFTPGQRKVLSITGIFGYCIELPENVKVGLYRYGQNFLSIDAPDTETGALVGEEYGAVKYRYAQPAAAETKPQRQRAVFEKLAIDYKFKSI